MTFTIDRSPSRLAAALTGDVDITASSQLGKIEDAASGCGAVSLDVSRVNFIDSTFLRFLVALRDRGGADRSVELIGAAPQVRRALTVTGLDRIFAVR